MMPIPIKPETTELGVDSKALLESTKSTVHGVKEDVEDIGHTVDNSQLTIEQTARELTKLRKEYEMFRFEVRRIIADEIEKQVKPLELQLKHFTTAKSKVIYIKWRFPFWERIGNGIKGTGSFLGFSMRWTFRKTFGRIRMSNRLL